MRRPRLAAPVVISILLIAGTLTDASAQARGGAGTPSSASIADLQRQIDALRAAITIPTRPKILFGEVFGNGSSSGTGWTAVANGDGSYTVTFTTAFSINPTVLATSQGNPAAPTHFITLEAVEATGFTAYLSEGAVGLIGAENWYFIAISPQ